VKASFLLSLGRHSKQASDEADLPSDVSLVHSSDLSLANHLQDLVSLECSSCRFNRKEAHPWFDQPLDEAMILFDQMVEVEASELRPRPGVEGTSCDRLASIENIFLRRNP
jgi:hypothetical protein